MLKGDVGVLKTSVAVEDRVRIRVLFYRVSECIEDKQIVIAVTDGIRDDTFVIDMNALVTIQVVSDPSIPLLWMCLVDLNDLFCKQAIFSLSFTELASLPFVIGTA